MKTIIINIIAIVLLSFNGFAQSGNNFTVPLSDPAKRGKLKVDINYGSITIKGTARKDVLVSYSSAKDDGNATSKDGLKRIGGGGLDLEASELNNNVIIESSSWSVKTDLEIEIPSGMDVVASTYNDGDILVTNVQGSLELENYNGEIKATNISGSVIASTYNGEVKVAFDKVTENTPMSFSTFNGDVDLTFPATYKATFKMKTEQGEIFTGFEMNITSSAPVQKKDTKSGAFKLVIDEWKKGDINGGGPEITLKNYNGDIYIRKK
ncbi:MAG: DUF4097 family beta strand repeat protein [Bacteroidetes bacterium]|nr:DUF4097 family beta strand repeat protein [Bacteroidota bacterium]